MDERKKLVQSTFIYIIGNFGTKVLSFFLVPVYSYFLTKSELGKYDLILTIVQVLVPLVSLQMSEAVYRWLLDFKDNISKQQRIVRQTLYILFGALFLFELCLYFVNSYKEIPYVMELSLLLTSSSILPYFQQIVRGLGKTKIYSISGVINSVLILTFGFAFLFFDVMPDKVIGILYSLIIANSLAVIYILLSSLKTFRNLFSFDFDWKMQKTLVYYSFPLIMNSVSWWLINASDRLIILKYLTIEDNGIYAISSRLPAILTILNTVFMLAWQDLVISTQDTASPFFSSLFNKYISLNLGLALVFSAASPVITYLLFDHTFYESWHYAPLLFVGSCFASLSGFIGALYLRSKDTKGILMTSIGSAVINTVVTIILIPFIGLYAPALGTFLSFIIMFFTRLNQTKEIMNFKFNVKSFCLIMLFISIILFVQFFAPSLIMSIILTLISLVVFFIINKELIWWMVKKLKNFI